MAITLESRSPELVAAPSPTRPVVWWAGAGAVFVAITVALYGRWIASDHFRRVPIGPSEIPGWMKAVAQAHDVVSVLAALAIAYWIIWRPWRRDGRPSFDGLLILALTTTYWQDIAQNYPRVQLLFNSALFNRGSWYHFLPGWMPPNSQNIVESPLFGALSVFWATYIPLVGANWIMRKVAARNPHLGRLALYGVAYAFLAGLGLAIEPLWGRLGVYVWPGAISGLTIFKGHYYQFPLYETFFWTFCWAGMAYLRYFRNDRGESVAERGIENVRATGRRRMAIRFLAIAGILNVMNLGYTVAMGFMALNSDPWPKDIAERSYFTNSICGPGTDYSCPVDGAPVPVRNSAYINREGELVDPTGKLRDLKPTP